MDSASSSSMSSDHCSVDEDDRGRDDDAVVAFPFSLESHNRQKDHGTDFFPSTAFMADGHGPVFVEKVREGHGGENDDDDETLSGQDSDIDAEMGDKAVVDDDDDNNEDERNHDHHHQRTESKHRRRLLPIAFLARRGEIRLFPTFQQELSPTLLDRLSNLAVDRLHDIAGERDSNREIRRLKKLQLEGTTEEEEENAPKHSLTDTDDDNLHPDRGEMDEWDTQIMYVRDRLVSVSGKGQCAQRYVRSVATAIETKLRQEMMDAADGASPSSPSPPKSTDNIILRRRSSALNLHPTCSVPYRVKIVERIHSDNPASQKVKLSLADDIEGAENTVAYHYRTRRRGGPVYSDPFSYVEGEVPETLEVRFVLERTTRRRPHRFVIPVSLRPARTQPGHPGVILNDDDEAESRRNVSISDADSALSETEHPLSSYDRRDAFWVNCYPSRHLRDFQQQGPQQRSKHGRQPQFPSIRIWVPRNTFGYLGESCYQQQLKKDLGLKHLDSHELKFFADYDASKDLDAEFPDYRICWSCHRIFYDIPKLRTEEGRAMLLNQRRLARPEPFHRNLALALTLAAGTSAAGTAPTDAKRLSKVLPPLAESCHGLIRRMIDVSLGFRSMFSDDSIAGLGVCRIPLGVPPSMILHSVRSRKLRRTVASKMSTILHPSDLHKEEIMGSSWSHRSCADLRLRVARTEASVEPHRIELYDPNAEADSPNSWANLLPDSDDNTAGHDVGDSQNTKKTIKHKKLSLLKQELRRAREENTNRKPIEEYFLFPSFTGGADGRREEDEEKDLDIEWGDFFPRDVIQLPYRTRPNTDFLSRFEETEEQGVLRQRRKEVCPKPDIVDGDAGSDDSATHSTLKLDLQLNAPASSLGYIQRRRPYQRVADRNQPRKKNVAKRITSAPLLVLGNVGQEEGYGTFSDFSEFEEDDLLDSEE